MAGVPVPQDWPLGGPLREVTFTLPDEVYWRSFLRGYFASLLREWEWDETTVPEGGGGPSGDVDITIAADFDDARQRQDGGTIRTDIAVRMSSDPLISGRWAGGFRFLNVALPNAAEITSAIVTLTPDDIDWDDANVTVYGQADDTTLDFDADARLITRPLTSAGVDWIEDGLGTGPSPSPDISLVIQEIIDRPGWSSGNDLALLIWGRSDVAKALRVEHYGDAPGLAARLEVSYGPPVPFTVQDAMDTALEILETEVIAP